MQKHLKLENKFLFKRERAGCWW